ncbi:MAG: hypothetical protein JWN76_3538 [Chitinophagaceae bacterium]|nr:hypothetical protein [Chitinophagaceae bacterium]
MQDQHQNRGLNPTDEPTNQSADADKTGQNYSADSGIAARDDGNDTEEKNVENGVNSNNQSAGGGSSTKSDLHNSSGKPADNV